MTVQEIKKYLKEHTSLTFRYHSKYYSLKRRKSLLGSWYSLIATDAVLCQRDSLEALCEQGTIGNGTPLMEAIREMEIPEWSDPAWETYEAVRHSAIVGGCEISFSYGGRNYWIAYTGDGAAHLSDNLGNTQSFRSCRDLWEKARINGESLADIWEKVAVDSC